MKNKVLLIVSLFLAFTMITAKVFAAQTPGDGGGGVQLQNDDLVEIPLSDKLILKDGTPVKDVFNSTDDMINLLVKVIFVGAGMFLLFMIIGAGLAMVQGESKDKDKAKTTMTSALIGFIIMFAAYWIMQILQLITGINMGF
jgi:hypothetical protein